MSKQVQRSKKCGRGLQELKNRPENRSRGKLRKSSLRHHLEDAEVARKVIQPTEGAVGNRWNEGRARFNRGRVKFTGVNPEGRRLEIS